MEQPRFDVRPYEADDFDACRMLWVQLTEHHREIYDLPGLGGDDPGSDWDIYVASPSRLGSWVVVTGDAIVGLGGLQTFDGNVEVEPMIVSQEVRGKGIGRLLMERLIAEARSLGHSALSIRSAARNTDALASWRAMGFTTVGMVELFRNLDGAGADRRPGAVLNGLEFDT